jgi:hypothetical protein
MTPPSAPEPGARLEHRYGTIDKQYAISLATRAPETDGPIYMVNLMKYRAIAEYAEGSSDAVSGREADDKYNPSSVLNKIGADMLFVADVVSNDFGIGDWDRIAVVRYPTRRSFVEMQQRKDFAEKHVHKAAGMERTIITCCRPDDPALDERGRPRITDVRTRHVAMVVLGPDAASSTAPPLATSFTSEGTVIGDSRPWSSVHFAELGGDISREAILSTYASNDPHSSYVLTLAPSIDGLTQ